MTRRLIFGAVATATVAAACQWQTRPDQQRERLAAEAVKPLQWPERPHPANPPRRLTVRVHADEEYRAQEPRWHDRFAEVIAAANDILRAWFGVEFHVVEMREWTRGPPRGLELVQLRAHDPGEDVDWVIGLVGRPPPDRRGRLDNGYSDLFSHHLVFRTQLDPDALKNLTSRYALEKSELAAHYAEKLLRTEAVALVHEWAHSLGAVHVNDPSCFMHSYEGVRFCQPNIAIVALGLERFREARTDAAAKQRWAADLRKRLLAANWGDLSEGPLVPVFTELTALAGIPSDFPVCEPAQPDAGFVQPCEAMDGGAAAVVSAKAAASALRVRSFDVHECIQAHMPTTSGSDVRVDVQLTVEADGGISGAEVHSNVASEDLATCLRGQLATLRFPAGCGCSRVRQHHHLRVR